MEVQYAQRLLEQKLVEACGVAQSFNEVPKPYAVMNPTTYTYIYIFFLNILKDSLQDWRSGSHPLGNTVPKYSPEIEDETDDVSPPELLVCEMSTDAATGEKKIHLNSTLRGKWMDDPMRKDEWLAELSKFDARSLTQTTARSYLIS